LPIRFQLRVLPAARGREMISYFAPEVQLVPILIAVFVAGFGFRASKISLMSDVESAVVGSAAGRLFPILPVVSQRKSSVSSLFLTEEERFTGLLSAPGANHLAQAFWI